ncbi:lamin tail domain-containing protein [Thermococcus paralvinellae]|uniref:Competence-like protein n=1 Tax=Thermococcus paralvinellae TaxID=582419 RepID=W0I2K8_9EURY|nr:lamin tail domain-containing protein [Thermococcus paralvinellae]AHF80286.1 competence-like protein [Thermococcus paralvinellae]
MRKAQISVEDILVITVAIILVGLVYHYLATTTSNYGEIITQLSENLTKMMNDQTCGNTSTIVIYYVHYNAKGNDWLNLNDEYVVISNIGCKDEDLTGWQLKDEAGHIYTFPKFVLKAGAMVTVHTGSGTNTATDLYWGRNAPVWNNNGDTAYLYDSKGVLIDKCSWTGKEGDAVTCH